LLREVAEETGAALLVVSHDPSILQHFPRCLDLREINTASHSASISSSASVGV
jgi:ABC-type lipoprotein export system ATPase subunit